MRKGVATSQHRGAEPNCWPNMHTKKIYKYNIFIYIKWATLSCGSSKVTSSEAGQAGQGKTTGGAALGG